MFLSQLSFTNFKNYPEEELAFSDKINCFVGDNGAGKTNILDAVYYLSFCKSYFNSVDSQNIRHKTDFFAIHGVYLNRNQETDIGKVSCIQKRNHKKQFKINKKEYSRLADHIGKIPLVMVSPYDRDLINEGSEIRRKYLDGVISQFDKFYLNDLLEYNKSLKQRNILLKQFAEKGFVDTLSLSVWDDKLVDLGEKLFEKRKAFIEDFNPLFNEFYKILSGDNENVEINYISAMTEGNFSEILQNSLQRDLALRYTTRGVHKDDLQFLMNGYPVKKFGSQGQQKTFVVAVKLAQFEYIKKKKGFKPILLFDDIFDKLDDRRVSQIIDLVSKEDFGQVFITDTHAQRIVDIFKKINIDHKIFFVENGKVTPYGI